MSIIILFLKSVSEWGLNRVDGKVDLRVKKTHRALTQALRELLCEKSFDEISVSELCDRAQTRRATFYMHFRDKSGLLAHMIQQLQQEHGARNGEIIDIQHPGAYLARIFGYLLDFLDENRDMARMIVNSQAENIVLDILSRQIESDLRAHFGAPVQDGEAALAAEMTAVLCSGAIASCAHWWIVRSDTVPKEKAVELFQRFMERAGY